MESYFYITLPRIIDIIIRCFYGICIFGFGIISFIPNIMMSASGTQAVKLGIFASFLFCLSGILGLLNSPYIPLFFANISLVLALLLQISVFTLPKNFFINESNS